MPYYNSGRRKRAFAHSVYAFEQYEKYGVDVLSDVDLLEAAIELSSPKVDAPTIGRDLLDRFGVYSKVVAAPPELLREVDGVTWITVLHLKMIMIAAQRFARDQLEIHQPVLSSSSVLLEYCRKAMAYESVEQLRVLYLDRKNRLIADEVQGRGTVDHVPVQAREVLRRALVLSASSLILVHNHPSGDPSPSAADLQVTQEIVAGAKTLRIVVHDHIIVGRQGHRSLRDMKLM